MRKTIAHLEQEVADLEAELGVKNAVPDAPAHLDEQAKAKWREITNTPDVQILVSDIDALTLYVTAWARWRDSEAKVIELGTVIKSPSGYPVQSPYLSIANKALEQVLKVGKRLGLADPRR